MNKGINDCTSEFHDVIRNYFESVGIRFHGDYPRVSPSNANSSIVYIFYVDNLIKLLKIYKKIDLMDDYKTNPTKYHSYLFERFEPILYDAMKKHGVEEFTIEFKDYHSPNLNVWELVLTSGLMVGKLYTKYQKK